MIDAATRQGNLPLGAMPKASLRWAGVAIGKIQLGVASGGSAKLAEPPEAAALAEVPLAEPEPLPEPLLHALTASVAATPSAARATGAERADLNTFLIFLQV